MKLYELSSAYRQLESALDDETADTEFLTFIAQVEGDLKEKAINIAKLVRNLDADAKAIKEASKAMTDRAKTAESRASRLRQYLLDNMKLANIHSIECEYFVLKVRDNPESVIIDDSSLLPAEYFRQPPPEPDKRAILADMKQGVVIDGAHIERGQRLEIE